MKNDFNLIWYLLVYVSHMYYKLLQVNSLDQKSLIFSIFFSKRVFENIITVELIGKKTYGALDFRQIYENYMMEGQIGHKYFVIALKLLCLSFSWFWYPYCS